MQLLALLGLLPVVLGEQFVIPQVASAVSQQLNLFQHYTDYAGPTGAAKSKLAATPSLRKLLAGPQATNAANVGAPYWYEAITHQGTSAFNANPSTYKVYRNVKDFGAKGDGTTDDTAAIQSAMSSGGRCAPGSCASSSVSPAVVYFPAGTYVVSSSIIDYYNTIILGNPNDMPVLKATPGFTGLGVIDGDQYQAGGKLGFGSTNIFWRQVRNFVIDLTAIPASSAATGIHWPTAQATSLQNIVFKMSSNAGTQHQGIFIEEGSGGFMNDLVFDGGLNGAVFGNQQFTMRNLTFRNAVTAITQLWDWGWTYQSISITNCTNGLNMSSIGATGLTVGSITYLDSSFTNVKNAIIYGRSSTSQPQAANSLALENIALTNVGTTILFAPYGSTPSVVLAGSSGSTTITAWGTGNLYNPNGATHFQGAFTPPARPAALLSGGKYYQRSKPQYNSLPVTSFSSVKTGGAKGDGRTDDTAALQSVINAAASAGKVVFFDAGTYKVTSTLLIPAGSKIVGEAYAVIMASGAYFSNFNAAKVVVQVGTAGATGVVEWSDMIVSTTGATAGAILIQWNLAAPAGSPGGMWDVHTRIGGTTGSNLQYSNCPAQAGNSNVNANCIAAYLAMHITKSAAGVYLENVWHWTADHDVEDAALRQITVYAGRGLLIESTNGPTWLVGTAVEHFVRYQYQLDNTKNVYMGQIQTETPYYQPSPPASSPFGANTTIDDPNFNFYCPSGLKGPCAEAWGLRVDKSSAIRVYGAGLYSFFSNYSTQCSNLGAGSNCQSAIFVYDAASTTDLFVYNLNTIGAFGMVYRDTTKLATYSNNLNVFPSTVWLFRNS